MHPIGKGGKMPTNKPQLKTYTDEETVLKFSIIARNESRSVSKQLEFIIKNTIADYEREHGEINLNDN